MIFPLLVIGDTASVVATEMALALAELNQHLEITKITGTGHALPFDQPDHFSTIVQAFLRSKC